MSIFPVTGVLQKMKPKMWLFKRLPRLAVEEECFLVILTIHFLLVISLYKSLQTEGDYIPRGVSGFVNSGFVISEVSLFKCEEFVAVEIEFDFGISGL